MKYFILILFFILSIIFPVSTFSNDELISNLQSGGNIVFIRHAIAPGSGDPNNIDLNDCRTQRNLSEDVIGKKNFGEMFGFDPVVDIQLFEAKRILREMTK